MTFATFPAVKVTYDQDGVHVFEFLHEPVPEDPGDVPGDVEPDAVELVLVHEGGEPPDEHVGDPAVLVVEVGQRVVDSAVLQIGATSTRHWLSQSM